MESRRTTRKVFGLVDAFCCGGAQIQSQFKSVLQWRPLRMQVGWRERSVNYSNHRLWKLFYKEPSNTLSPLDLSTKNLGERPRDIFSALPVPMCPSTSHLFFTIGHFTRMKEEYTRISVRGVLNGIRIA